MLGLAATALAARFTDGRETTRQDSQSASRPTSLPTPTFDRERILRRVAGLRPFRTGGIRIERVEIGGKIVVHDYGHGGAGFTL